MNSGRPASRIADSLTGLLLRRSAEQPDSVAYTFLERDSEVSWTYGELDARAREIGATLQRHCAPGERVVLVLPPGLDYVASFFGCLYAGVIAVPVYPPNGAGLVRSLSRLEAIVSDARPTAALTLGAVAAQRDAFAESNPLLGTLRWIGVDTDVAPEADWRPVPVPRDALAFLQYTSGSTGTPKGVMVSHSNLLHNGADIERFFQLTPDSKTVIWLPPYHDMGLIGGILQPLYTGYPTVLMAPMAFAADPLRWLRTISDHRATTSGGPNFGYELCLRKISPEQLEGLDLSCWQVAFNGAEPVRADVMDAFADFLAPTGFRREAFYPCYGLAEGTLIVTGGSPKAAPVVRETEGADPVVGCGQPSPEQELAIVDPETRRRRVDGEVGEIWVSGPSVAQGYWERPETSAEVFGARIEGSGEGPFLRTGDLGYVVDGELFVSGRIKDLIILRGVNHYPQDIEYTAFRSHPALRHNGGACFTIPVDGQEVLVVTHEAERVHRDADVREVAAAVRAAVGENHLIAPYAFALVRPGRLPRTSSGKIQRFAAREQYLAGTLTVLGVHEYGQDDATEASAAAVAEPAPARTPEAVEAFLRAGVARRTGGDPDALDLGMSGPALGLDSLDLLEIQHEVEKAFGVELGYEAMHGAPVRDVLTTVAAAVEAARDMAGPDATGPDAPPAASPDELSHGERGLWFLDHVTGCGPAYNIAGAVRLPDDVDPAALHRALDQVVERHTALRTSYSAGDGQPVRRIDAERKVVLDRTDVADDAPDALEDLLADAAAEPFDLTEGPLVRARLCAGADGRRVLLLVMHHIVADFWSMSLVVDELARCYRAVLTGTAAQLPPAGDYADFVAAQKRYTQSPEGEAAAAFWGERLGGELPVLELPTDRPRPPVQTYRGDTHDFTVDAELLGGLTALARQSGTTLYTALLCAFEVLLHRYSGQTDILVGSPVSGRGRPAYADTVGYFVNPVVIRGDLGGDPVFRELLARFSRTVSESLAHQTYPFGLLAEQLQAGRDPARSPVFQAMFIHHQAPSRFPGDLAAVATGHGTRPFTVAGLDLAPVHVPQRTAQFDLTMIVAEHGDGLVGRVQFNADLFDRATVADLADNFRTLLAGITADPDRPLSALPLLSEEKSRRVLVDWNDTALDLPGELCVHEEFEAAAARTPDAVAVVFRSALLTYGELSEASDRLARELVGRGVGAESRVGICLDRSPELVVAMLGVLKAGGAYVPLDPDYPRDRLDVVVSDARLDLLVTRRRVAHRVAEGGVPLLDVDTVLAAPDGQTGCPAGRASADNAAYLLYTSGSTGVPKGVVVTHRNVGNFFAAMDQKVGCGTDDTMLAVTNAGFDISVLELLWTLTRGAKVVLAEDVLSRQAAPAAPAKPVDFSLFFFASDARSGTDDAGRRYDLVFDSARFADEHGFTAVWTPERHFHEFGGLYPNPSVLSAAIAAVTRNVAVRAGSVVLPLHSPVRVAEEWSLVDNISGGRAGVAFASGWHADDFVFFPERYEDRKEQMFRDIDTVQRLWRGETVSLPGGTGKPVDVAIRPAPLQPALPTWITAAGSPDTFARAGAIGANVLTHLLGQTVEQVAENVRRYREARLQHGHDPDAGVVTLMLHTFLGDDVEAVKEQVREPFTAYLRSSVGLIENLVRTLGLPVDLAAMSKADMDDLLEFAFNRYFDTGALFGTPESVRPLIERCAEAGVDEIACLVDFGLPRQTVLDGLPALDQVRRRSGRETATDAGTAGDEDRSLAGQIAAWRPTLLQATPSAMRLMALDKAAVSGLASLRALLLGGEALPPDLARELREQLPARLINMYGPTETTIWSATHEVTAVEEMVPLGGPIANTQIHIVDDGLRPVPVGVAGELVIGGAGLARGYWGRPDATAEKFVPNPFTRTPGARLYRTGDLARYRPDGRVEFLGRIDRQVKVRGHRIELGDIEAVLAAREDVREAVVIAQRESSAGTRLVACVVAADGAAPSARDLQRGLRERLPQSMIPSGFVLLPDLPRTAHGKVDVKALAALEWSGSGNGAKAAPVTELERSIAVIWSEVLGVESVGLYDNFFDLGGHSMLMVQVHNRLQRETGVELPLIKLLEHPTVSALAAHLGEGGADTEQRVFSDSEARARRQRDSRRRSRGLGGRGRA
ncbi:MupA/Atu3671 family FMN-dependent luciferase-like monooxygenase [Streptomyces sp. AC550_RSS872]|uniref:MupA/Atu3671 family FMN-dependent luciferase-like monooxygenase n=1 Tax=Streptomyces sp. AC550_RSS872 TaxID=2823689 RepID=UPI001C27B299|nr:MupA/Atu3671 family FMN-dependent luciferase-like monooxygenase [Streptomyces sp. AC550_RSS872]